LSPKSGASEALKLTLPSFAKINWDLRILGRRADGFHELETVFQTISLHDTLTFEPNREGIRLRVEGISVPDGESNLIVRAARLLVDQIGTRNGAAITLYKRIPVGAGLGGGSSNAAITLTALNRIWDCGLTLGDLEKPAGSLGSDVVFFLTGGTAFGRGRGEVVVPMADLPETELLVVNPGFPVATGEVFQALNLPFGRLLTSNDPDTTIRRFQQNWKRKRCKQLKNDLESTVLARYPLLAEMKASLREAGCEPVLLCGSGSSLVAARPAPGLELRLKKMEVFRTAWIFRGRTITASRYRGEIGL